VSAFLRNAQSTFSFFYALGRPGAQRAMSGKHVGSRLRVPDNSVEVRYTIHLRNKPAGQSNALEELHVMRCWSVPELRGQARSVGVISLDCGAWMAQSPPLRETWYAWMLLRRE
jgi:hypothetical protein